MKTKTLTTKKRDYVKEFIEAWSNGHKEMLKAAKIFVAAIDKDPANRGKIYEGTKGLVTPRAFQLLEAVGRKTLDERLLMGTGGQHTVRIKRLPFDLQKRVIDGDMFEFLTADGSKMKICLRDCEDWQAKQMFADDHIRTLPQQKAWAEAEKAKLKSTEIEHTVPFEIRKKDVLFKENTSLTFEEVRQLALQLH